MSYRVSRFALLAWLPAVVAASVVAVDPAPAQAAVSVQVVTANSSTNSASAKGLTITCPTDTEVLGGGGYVVNGANRVHISALRPMPGVNSGFPDTFAVGASEIRPGDYASGWSIHGYAICGAAPAGLEYVSAASAVNSSSTRHVELACPGTKKLLSVGAIVFDEDDHVVIDDIAVKNDLRSADVWAVEREDATVFSWSVNAYGVCVNGNAVAGLTLVQTTSVTNGNNKVSTATCPVGKKLLGAGFAQSMAAGHTLVQQISPNSPAQSAAAGAVNDPTGAPNPWSLTAQAICAS